MMLRGRFVGATRVDDPKESLKPDSEVCCLLEAMADLGALVFEKVRLHQSLYRISEALNSTFDLKTMLDRVLAATVEEMNLKGASLRLLDLKKKTVSFVATFGLSDSYTRSRAELPLEKSMIDRLTLNGETVVIHDLKEEAETELMEETLNEGIRPILAVPIILKTQKVGVMRVYYAQPREFTDVAVTFLQFVSDLVGLAIESTELHAAPEKRIQDLKLDLADWHRFLGEVR